MAAILHRFMFKAPGMSLPGVDRTRRSLLKAGDASLGADTGRTLLETRVALCLQHGLSFGCDSMGVRNIYERFIWFDHRARTHKYPNATTLAGQFEISTKTAQRDIDFMRDRLLCPLEYDVRERGYAYEDDTFQLPMVYLSSGELSALLIAKKMLQDISGGQIGGEISSIVGKITNILSRRVVTGDHVEDAVSLRMVGYSPVPERVFRNALEGCLARRRLHLTYCSPAADGETVRTVDPYHLFSYMGNWHLIAHCHLRNHIRDFALNRISTVKVLEETFDLPEDFDVAEYFRSSFGIFKGGEKEEVTLRFSAEKAKWIKDQVWHPDQEIRHLKDGSFELSFPVADFPEIRMEILKHGETVEVIKPKSLRLLIEAEARNILKIYRGTHKKRAVIPRPKRRKEDSRRQVPPPYESLAEAVPG